MHFVFLDRLRGYDGESLRAGPLGGVASATVRLAEALAVRGHRVQVLNERDSVAEQNGVGYAPLAAAADLPARAVLVANTDVTLLAMGPQQAVHAVWVRNNIDVRTLRKKRAGLAALRLRPHLVFPGAYAASRTPWFLPFRSRTVIEHGVDPVFLEETGDIETVRPPVAVYASQPRRGLAAVAKVWAETVRPAAPQARLRVFHPVEKLTPEDVAVAGEGVEIVGAVDKPTLAAAFRAARVMIYPGHKEETFCNAAAEALACGTPVATQGIGALGERVRHGVDGFVERDPAAMGARAAAILADDALSLRLSAAARQGSRGRRWDIRAAAWEEAVEAWLRRARVS